MKNYFLMLLLLISSILLISCGDDGGDNNGGDSCDPACESWESCNNGNCELLANRCNSQADCTGDTTCNTENHICEPNSTTCDPACESWESCNNGTCELLADRCNSQTDCTGDTTCNTENHICEPNGTTCDPACENWETCNDGICELLPNRCNNEGDCNEGENCNPDTHSCESESTECNPECEEWQTCTEGYCVLDSGRCEEDNDCADNNICNLTTHYCQPISTECSDQGLNLFFEYENIDLCINTDDAIAYAPDGYLIGVKGTFDDKKFIIRRDGDIADGSFETAADYTMEYYPFKLLIQVWSSQFSDCEAAGDDCLSYRGTDGVWDISSITPFEGDVDVDQSSAISDDSCGSSCGSMSGRWSVDYDPNSTCNDEGGKFFLQFNDLCINSDDVIISYNSDNGIIGIEGSSDSKKFFLRRDGDYTDGEFLTVGKYDMSSYPYILSIDIWDSEYSDCESAYFEGGECITYYAPQGEWDITSITPFSGSAYGTFVVSEDDENCWDDETGNLDNCTQIPGELNSIWRDITD